MLQMPHLSRRATTDEFRAFLVFFTDPIERGRIGMRRSNAVDRLDTSRPDAGLLRSQRTRRGEPSRRSGENYKRVRTTSAATLTPL